MNQKFDPCFSDSSRSSPSGFFRANRIILRPTVISEFFNYFEDLEEHKQIGSLASLLEIIPGISHNAAFIVQKTRNNCNYSPKSEDLIDVIIQLALNQGKAKESVREKLTELLNVLMRYNRLTKHNLQSVYQALSDDFYSGSSYLDYTRFATTINILSVLYRSQMVQPENQPSQCFYFQGKENALALTQQEQSISSQIPLWKFDAGICVCLWFKMEKLRTSPEEHPSVSPQKLFTIHTASEGKGGGLEAYFIGNELFYRQYSSEIYADPTEKTNAISLGTFTQDEWHFVGIDHENSKASGKSNTIKIVADKNQAFSQMLDFPKITTNFPIKKFSFGDNFIGKISSIIVFSQPIGSSQIELLAKCYQYGFQSELALSNLHISFEKIMNKVYLLLCPLRYSSSKNKCYDVINSHHATLSDKSGVFQSLPLKVRIKELGGIQSLLPYVYLLRFVKREPSHKVNLLNECLSLIADLFKHCSDLQQEAYKINLIPILSHLFQSLDSNYFDSETFKILKYLQEQVTEPQLSASIFIDLLWRLSSVNAITKNTGKLDCNQQIENSTRSVNSQFLDFISSQYEQKFEISCKLFSAKDIINSVTFQQAIQPSLNISQLPESAQFEKQSNDIISSCESQEYLQTFKIIENIIINTNNTQDSTSQLIQLFQLLYLESSEEFHLSVLNTILRFFKLPLRQQKVSQQEKQLTEAKIKTLIKIFTEQKGIHAILYLMFQSKSIQIRTRCIQILSLIFSTKSASPSLEAEVCSFISEFIWRSQLGLKSVRIQQPLPEQEQLEERQQIPANPFTISQNVEANNNKTSEISQTSAFQTQLADKIDDFPQFNLEKPNIFGGSKSRNLGNGSVKRSFLQVQVTEDSLVTEKPSYNHQETIQQTPSESNGNEEIALVLPKPSMRSKKKPLVLSEDALDQNKGGEQQVIQNTVQPQQQQQQFEINQQQATILINPTDIQNNVVDFENQQPISAPPPPKKSSLGAFRKKLAISSDAEPSDFNKNQPPTSSFVFPVFGSTQDPLLNGSSKEPEITPAPYVLPARVINPLYDDPFSFSLEPSSAPFDALKVAENPGFMQAPSMLNRRQHTGFSFPDLQQKARPAEKQDAKTNNYMEPQKSKKSGEAMIFTFPNQRKTENSENNNEGIQLSMPKKATRKNFKLPELVIEEQKALETVTPEGNDNRNLDANQNIVENGNNNGFVPLMKQPTKKTNLSIQEDTQILPVQPILVESNDLGISKPLAAKKRGFKKKPGGLEINIETINEKYFGVGGETAMKELALADLAGEERDIAELARVCVQYMKGMLIYNEDDIYDCKMPVIQQKQFNVPMSVRGIKNIALAPDLTDKPLNAIAENAAQENEEMSFSMDLNKEVNSVGPTPKSILPWQDERRQLSSKNQQQKTEQEAINSSDKTQEKCSNNLQAQQNDQPTNPQDIVCFSEQEQAYQDQLYSALMSWLLSRPLTNDVEDPSKNLNPTKLNITSKDKIISVDVLPILFGYYNSVNDLQKLVILADFLFLVKQNSDVLLNHQRFYFWLLDILLEQQILMFDDAVEELEVGESEKYQKIMQKSNPEIYEICLKIHKAFLNGSILGEKTKKGEEIFNWMFNWLNTHDSTYTFQTASKYLLRILWQNTLNEFLASLDSNSNCSNDCSVLQNLSDSLILTTQRLLLLPSEKTNKEIPKKSNSFLLSYCSLMNFAQIFTQPTPNNFRAQRDQSKWLDMEMLSLFTKLLDLLWKESAVIDCKCVKEWVLLSTLLIDMLMIQNQETQKHNGNNINFLGNASNKTIVGNSSGVDTLELGLDRLCNLLKALALATDNTNPTYDQTILFSLQFLYEHANHPNQSIQALLHTYLESIWSYILPLAQQSPHLADLLQNSLNSLSGSDTGSFLYFSENKSIQELETILSKVTSNEWRECFIQNNSALKLFLVYFNELQKSTNLPKQSNTNTHNPSFNHNYQNSTIQSKNLAQMMFSSCEDYLKKAKSELLSQLRYNEEKQRSAKHHWSKLWERLRAFNGIWKPSDLTYQNDYLFDSTKSTTENKFYYLKVDNHEARNLSRPFLKLKLKDPEIVRYQQQEKDEKDLKDQIKNIRSNIEKSTSINEKFSAIGNQTQEFSNGDNSGNQQNISEKPGNQEVAVSLKKQAKDTNIPYQLEEQEQQQQQLVFSTCSGDINLLVNGDVQFSKKCQLIKALTTLNGILYMTDDSLIFQEECFDQSSSSAQQYSSLSLFDSNSPSKSKALKIWLLRDIREVQLRKYLLKKSALEIFLLHGSTILLNFPEFLSDAEEVSSKLIRNRKRRCPNIQYYNTLDPKKLVEKTAITGKWLNREISTFQYLMQLNTIASRSFGDLTQYPVFPWILMDYQTSNINEISSRNLSKSMGCVGTSPELILNYLQRLEPYTQGYDLLMDKLNNTKIQCQNRQELFNSLGQAFYEATNQLQDARELIPEMFYLPELFVNYNKRQEQEQQESRTKKNNAQNISGPLKQEQLADNVALPPWAEFNPYKFIVMHRQALESERVSAKINEWIDLFFGCKQSPKETEKNNSNVQQQLDLASGNQVEMSINFGQTPWQLFPERSHPQREPLSDTRLVADFQSEIKVFRPSTGKKKKSSQKEVKPVDFFSKDISDEAIIFLKWVSESRFMSLRRNGQITLFRWYTSGASQVKQTAIPFQCGEDKKREVTIDKIKRGFITEMDDSVFYSQFPCCLLKDSKIMIIGGLWDGSIRVIQVDSDQLLDQHFLHTDTVTYLTSDIKENFLFTGSKNGEVIVWKIEAHDTMKLSLRYSFHDHSQQVNQIAVSKDLVVFATASLDSTINLYNLISGQFYRTFNHPSALPIDNIIFGYSPLPCVVFFSSGDRTLYSYSMNGQLLAKSVQEFSYLTSQLVLTDSLFSNILAIGSERGELCLRELPFLQLRKTYSVSVSSQVLSIVLSKDRKFLLCGCSDGYISVLTDPLSSKFMSSSPASVRQQSLLKSQNSLNNSSNSGSSGAN